MKLLHIEASPRGEASASSRVADAFVNAYRRLHPDHVVERLALFEEQLPAFGAEGADQKTEQVLDLVGGGTGIEATGEWAGVMREVERLASADKVLLSSPMWNFSIPYPLKHYIDLICQPGLTFRVDARGYVGLVTGKPLQLVLASGGSYPAGFPSKPTAPPRTSSARTWNTLRASSASTTFARSASNGPARCPRTRWRNCSPGGARKPPQPPRASSRRGKMEKET